MHPTISLTIPTHYSYPTHTAFNRYSPAHTQSSYTLSLCRLCLSCSINLLSTMLASLPCPDSPEWKANYIHTRSYTIAIHVPYCRLTDKPYYLFCSLYDTTRSKAKEFISINAYSLLNHLLLPSKLPSQKEIAFRRGTASQ